MTIEPSKRRKVVQNRGVNIRVSDMLLANAAVCAEARGVSVSEFMRQAVSMQVERTKPHPANLLSKRDTLHRRASQGDLQSQRLYVTELIMAGLSDPSVWGEMIREAEIWANIAAANGEHQDVARAVQVVGLAAEHAKAVGDARGARERETKSLAMLSVMADEGDEHAARSLSQAAEIADADHMKGALALAASWRAGA